MASTIMIKLKTAKDRLNQKLQVLKTQLETEDTDIVTLEVNSRKLKIYHDRVTSLRSDLEVAVQDPTTQKTDKDAFKNEIAEYEKLYLDTEEALAEVSVRCEQREKKRTSFGGESFSSSSSVKLPKLPQLKFNGDVTMYREFMQSFDATVDCSALPLGQKLEYLKRMLVDEAENDLKGLAATNENYSEARRLLEDKYGNKTRAIKTLYLKLSQLPKTTSQNVKRLREKYDELEVLLRSLESFGESFENNTILFNTIVQKYPSEVVYEVHQSSQSLTLKEFRTKIKALILKREELNFEPEEEDPVSSTTEALAVSNITSKNTIRKPAQKKCIFCNSDEHWSDECKKYDTLESRRAQLKGRCFICLRRNHSSKDCTVDRSCVHCGQKNYHHRSLCPKLLPPTQSETKTDKEEPKSKTEPNNTTSCLLSEQENNWLLTAVTTIADNANQTTHSARLILDAGSKRSYITTKLSSTLKLPIEREETLNIGTFGDKKQETTSNIVNFQIHIANGDPIVIQANTIATIIDNIETFDPNQLEDKSVLRGKRLADTTKRTDVDVLIGLDYLFDFLTPEMIQIGKNQYLVNSKLGWLFAGKVNIQSTKKQTKCLLLNAIRTDTNDDLKKLWELDTLGIKIPTDISEENVLQSFNENIKYEDKRYEISWPWKESKGNIDLKPNFGLAVGRLESLLKRSAPEYLSKYNEVIQEYIRDGIVEVVDESESADLIHYIPHHGVETDSKTTPLRIVFDGSARQSRNDKSLNDCIYKGSNLYEHVVKVLLNFRCFDDGIISDIRKAFLQIMLAKKDRDVVRFAWVIDPQIKTTKDNLLILRFRRLLFGINVCPYVLAATLHHHLTNFPDIPEYLISKLLHEFYVDNLVSGETSLEGASSLLEAVNKIMAEASMELRQWQTNNKKLIEKYPDIDWSRDEIVSVLGLKWNTINDTLSLKTVPLDTTIVTKRTILKVASRVYDPLGLFAPVTLRSKLILRQLWEKKLDWDFPVTEELEPWNELVADLQKLSSLEIPRIYLPSLLSHTNIQLHVFTDASQVAYGLAVYVRVEHENDASTQLVFAKSRVAPLRGSMTIPQLELIATVVGNRALNFVKNALIHCQVDKMFLWTDSKCVIEWIKSKKLLSTFVKRRVEEIKLNQGLIINYVKSEDNPADIASRGGSLEKLGNDWWKGPQWLRGKILPTSTEELSGNFDVTDAAKNTETMVNTAETSKNISSPYNIVAEDYTELESLLKITVQHISSDQQLIDVEDIWKLARQVWIEYVQKVHFSEVFEAQKKNKISNLEKQLNLHVDEHGLLRVKGRLPNIEPEFPILLPAKSHFTKLLIMNIHKKLYHSGVSHTLAEVKKSYWLTRGRATVYHLIRKCTNCKFYSAPAYRYPEIPPLPDFRAKREKAFAYTGVDTLGPLMVKEKNSSKTSKVWICLFTCMVTRAVHLELLEDMTADETQLAFRRFFATRTPIQLLSDNAPQFRLLKSLFANDQLTWKMVPEFSPWSGGIYERIVSLVKNALRRTLFNVTLTLGQLRTAVSEVAAVLNSRPIAYVGADDKFVISPGDLINVQWNIPTEFDCTKPTTITGKKLVEGWKNIDQQLNSFWNIWRYDYVESLRVPWCKKTTRKRAAEGPPKIGVTVIVQEKLLPRGRWKCGKICALISDRAASIKLENGKVINRPINLLHPLEVDD